MIENIKNEIFLQLEILFAEIVTCELANDMDSYQKGLLKIAQVANTLGIKTDIVKIHFKLRDQISDEN